MGCQQIKLKIGFFSLITLKPKQHLKLFGSFVAKTWQHFHSVPGSTEPISRARTLLSFPTYPTPCGAQACGPQEMESWSSAHIRERTSGNSFVQKQ